MIQWLGLRASTARAGSSQKKKIKSHHTPGKFKRIRNVNVKNKTIQVPKENMSRLPYNLVAWNTSYDSKIKQKGQRLMNFFFSFFFWPCCAACGTFVPQGEIKPGPLAVRAWSPHHWTAREFPEFYFHKNFCMAKKG